MVKQISTLAILLILVLCVACGGGGGGSHVLYAISPGSSQVAAYSLSGGTVSAVGSPASAGTTPMAVAVGPSNKFLCTANFGSNDISLFTLQSDGSVNSGPTSTATGLRPISIAVDPSGKYLYTADQAGESLSAFTIDSSSGALALGSRSPLGFTPSAMTLSPQGDLLFIAAQGYVLAFSVSSGTPTFLTYYSGAIFPTSLVVDPSEKFLYISDVYSNTIVAFTIGSSGLSRIAGSPFGIGGGQPQSLAIDASGTYLFTANHSTNNVSVAKIDSTTGALSMVSGSPFAAGTGPSFVIYDKSSSKVYVSNQGSNNISAFSVGSDGTLAASGTSSVLTGPTWIASSR